MADTTPTLREAAQQALEAIEPVMAYGRFGTRDVEQAELQKAHATLRAALAEQAADGWCDIGQANKKLRRLLTTAPATEQAEPQWQLERMRHIANEWADMATNGLQWLRNIKEGISNVDDALANMARCYEHCRRVNDAQGLYGEAAPPAPARQEWQPIETAPIGRNVIVAAPMEAGGYYVEEAWFSEDSDQWWPANVDPTDAHGSPIYPTLWQPLPAAPITAAPAEGGAA